MQYLRATDSPLHSISRLPVAMSQVALFASRPRVYEELPAYAPQVGGLFRSRRRRLTRHQVLAHHATALDTRSRTADETLLCYKPHLWRHPLSVHFDRATNSCRAISSSNTGCPRFPAYSSPRRRFFSFRARHAAHMRGARSGTNVRSPVGRMWGAESRTSRRSADLDGQRSPPEF